MSAVQPMPRALYVTLAGTLVVFYASNAFSSSVSQILVSAKWLPLGVLLLVAAMTLRPPRRAPHFPALMTVPIAALLLLMLVSVFAGVDPGHSLLALATIVLSIACGYVLSAAIVATNSRQAFFDLIANLGRLLTGFSALFLVARVNLGRGSTQGLSAWTDNPNTLAAILVPAAILFFAGCIRRQRGWLFLHAPFLLVATVLIMATSSRASLIWLMMSMAAFWIYRRGLAVTSLVLMTAAIAIVVEWRQIIDFLIEYLALAKMPSTVISPLSGREEVWRFGWELFQERPGFGYGIGTSQDLILAEARRFLRHQGSHFHSSYLAALVETGLPGCLALVATLGATLIRGLGDSDRTRPLQDGGWVLSALPWALVLGAAGHALFESWLLNAGNVNMMLFWTCIWLIHHQAQIPVRAVAVRPPWSPAGARPALSAP